MKKVMFSVLAILLAFSLWLAPATAQEYVNTKTLSGHTSNVSDVAFVNNSTLISGGYLDDTLRAWDLTTGRQLWSWDVGNPINVVAVPLHNPHYAAYGGRNDFNIRLRYTDDGDWRGRVQGHTDVVYGLTFHPNSHRLASGSDDNTIRIWDTLSNTSLRHIRTLRGHTGDVRSVAWSPDGQTLASGSTDGTVRLWNPNNGVNFTVLRGHRSTVTSVAWSPDSDTLASGSSDDTIKIWDVDTERTVRTLRGHPDSVISVAWSPDGDLLASVGVGNTVMLWNPNTGSNTATLRGHTNNVISVAWSPDGEMLVTGSTDRTIRVWESLSLDVTGNGVVNTFDLAAVAQEYGKTVAGGADRRADVNDDGRVDIEDLTLVAKAINPAFAAPSVAQELPNLPFTREDVAQWIRDAKATGIDAEGIAVLEQLLAALAEVESTPLETAVFANFPNPFNPETWIPYQLATAAEVKVSIHSADGRLVRTLELGQMPAGVYQSKSRAAYWDGRNTQGERVASGVYFYTLKAGDFSATKKMLIRK